MNKDIHPVNNYYASVKIIDISNSIDATKTRIKQHELYIMVYVYTKCNGARTANSKVIDFFHKTLVINVNNYYATLIITSENLTQSVKSY